MYPASALSVCLLVTVTHCDALDLSVGPRDRVVWPWFWWLGSNKSPPLGSDQPGGGVLLRRPLPDTDCGAHPPLLAAVTAFGSFYTDQLKKNLEEAFPLKELNIGFEQASEQLSGRINIRNGLLNFGTSLQVVGEPICSLVDNVDIPVGHHYKLRFIVLTFNYEVEVGSETMAGTVQANLRDQDLWSYYLASRAGSGKCSYNANGLHMDSPHLERYEALFKTTQHLSDPQLTRLVETFINTFVLTEVFEYDTQVPLLYDAFEKANRKTISEAAASYREDTGTELCDVEV